MVSEGHFKPFRNGRNQVVRILRELELPGKDAVLRTKIDRLIVEPAIPTSLLARVAFLRPLDEDFPPVDELPHEPVEF